MEIIKIYNEQCMVLSIDKPTPVLIPIEQLQLWEDASVRKEYVLSHIAELAESIKENGIIVPLFVKEKEPHKIYLVFSGQRRFEACKLVGLKKIPCFVFKTTSLTEARILSFSENLYREGMTPEDKSHATNELYKKFKNMGKVAHALGVEESAVRHYLRFSDIPEELRKFSKPKLGELSAKEIEDIYFKFLDLDRAVSVAKKLASYRRGTVHRRKYHESIRRSSDSDDLKDIVKRAERLVKMKKFVIFLSEYDLKTFEKIAFTRMTSTKELMVEILEQWVEEYLGVKNG